MPLEKYIKLIASIKNWIISIHWGSTYRSFGFTRSLNYLYILKNLVSVWEYLLADNPLSSKDTEVSEKEVIMPLRPFCMSSRGTSPSSHRPLWLSEPSSPPESQAGSLCTPQSHELPASLSARASPAPPTPCPGQKQAHIWVQGPRWKSVSPTVCVPPSLSLVVSRSCRWNVHSDLASLLSGWSAAAVQIQTL